MKLKYPILIGILLLLGVLGVSKSVYQMQRTNRDPVPGSCTIFSVKMGDQILFGNNEDYYKPQTFVWTEPATPGNYGCLYLGFKDYAHQGGINEKGLCFDANALPNTKINPHAELSTPPTFEPPYETYEIWAPVLILRKASTVEEAIEIASKYQRKNWYPKNGEISYQLNLADTTGDAVVISVDKNGELAFTRKQKNENYLISTNYNKVNPENALEFPCPRYQIAEGMLSQLQEEKDLSVDFVAAILDSVHVEGVFNTTLYSNIFDLKKGLLYLYHWHQFEEVVVLDVKEELAKGASIQRIKDLFSAETTQKASTEYRRDLLFLCLSILLGIGASIAGIHYAKKYVAKQKAKKSG